MSNFEIQAAAQPSLLHPENFDFPLWDSVAKTMVERLNEVDAATRDKRDPDLSIVIRTRNNAEAISQLFDELHQQVFQGEVQVVLVDTESTDGTVQEARAWGATVVSIAQHDFSYPKALNRGFEAADHPYVYSLVGHSNLSNTHTLRGVTRWCGVPNFGGAYGVSLPNRNARIAEWAGERLVFGLAKLQGRDYMAPSAPINKVGLGTLASNCAVVALEAWLEFGGFDETYGAGGEDGALARSMLDEGLTIIREPVLSAHHTHGLGPWHAYRQLREWQRVSKPLPFDAARLASYRPDLALQPTEPEQA